MGAPLRARTRAMLNRWLESAGMILEGFFTFERLAKEVEQGLVEQGFSWAARRFGQRVEGTEAITPIEYQSLRGK